MYFKEPDRLCKVRHRAGASLLVTHMAEAIFSVVISLLNSCAGGERAQNLESEDLDVTPTLLVPTQGTIDNSQSCYEPPSLHSENEVISLTV